MTLEVSHLDIFASKVFMLKKRALMSVMAETHQSAMAPYVAMAVASFALKSVTAVFREAFVVKVEVQACVGVLGEGGGGGGEGQLPGPQLEP